MMKDTRKTGRKPKPAVSLRSKHDTQPRRKAGKLADHPAMKELARMIDAGEVDRGRTLAYLKKGRKP